MPSGEQFSLRIQFNRIGFDLKQPHFRLLLYEWYLLPVFSPLLLYWFFFWSFQKTIMFFFAFLFLEIEQVSVHTHTHTNHERTLTNTCNGKKNPNAIVFQMWTSESDVQQNKSFALFCLHTKTRKRSGSFAFSWHILAFDTPDDQDWSRRKTIIISSIRIRYDGYWFLSRCVSSDAYFGTHFIGISIICERGEQKMKQQKVTKS